MRAGLVDQVQVWVAPVLLGGEAAVRAVTGSGVTDLERALRLTEPQWRKVGDDLLLQGYVVAP